MPLAGIIATILAVALPVFGFSRSPRRRRFGLSGWIGLAMFCGCGGLLGTPLDKPALLVAAAWTGYILATDSAVRSIRGFSLATTRPHAFLWLAVLSVFLWLPFEWYNHRLAAWYRSGLPAGPVRYLLLGWASACIWPALFETADFFLALMPRSDHPSESPIRSRLGWTAPVAALGGISLALPLMLPRLDAGERLVPLAACGFLLLLDPLNLAGRRASLWGDWLAKRSSRTLALALAGLSCGLLADCLNYGAEARWHIIYPAASEPRLFELPLVGYLILPLFALQAFAMHVFVAGLLDLPVTELPSAPDLDTPGHRPRQIAPG